MKAYDSVNWSFVLKCLEVVGVLDKFIQWLEAYITYLKFSIAFNGSQLG